MNATHAPTSALAEAWNRLEAVCRRLWDENSACAVEAQAVVEEFKGEVHRLDALVANIEEHRAQDRRGAEENLAALRRQYEMELASLKKRLELTQASVHERDGRIDDLLKTVARKEDENLEFHSQVLRLSATTDENKSKRMEEFYAELMEKEAAQEGAWLKRRHALESEHAQIQKIIEARQAELDALEERRLGELEALKKRETDLEIRSGQLTQEYRKKQQEIDDLKASLQRSITDLVRQYQSRLRTDNPPTGPR